MKGKDDMREADWYHVPMPVQRHVMDVLGDTNDKTKRQRETWARIEAEDRHD